MTNPGFPLEDECIELANRLLELVHSKPPRHAHAYARGIRWLTESGECPDYMRLRLALLALRALRFAGVQDKVILAARECMDCSQWLRDARRDLRTLCEYCFEACPVDWQSEWIKVHFPMEEQNTSKLSAFPPTSSEVIAEIDALVEEFRIEVERADAEHAAYHDRPAPMREVHEYNESGLYADLRLMLDLAISEGLPKRTTEWAGSYFSIGSVHRYGVGYSWRCIP